MGGCCNTEKEEQSEWRFVCLSQEKHTVWGFVGVTAATVKVNYIVLQRTNGPNKNVNTVEGYMDNSY